MVSSCCCGLDRQKACIITGTIEIVMAGVFLIINSVTLIMETPLALDERDNAIVMPDPYKFHAIRLILCGINTCYWIGCLFLGMILLIGAKQRDLRRLRTWFILTCILTVLFITDVFMEAFSMRAPILSIISPTLGTMLQCYMIWVVTELMEEIQKGCFTVLVKAEVEDNP